MKIKEYLKKYQLDKNYLIGARKVPKDLDKKWLEAGNTRKDAEQWAKGWNDCHAEYVKLLWDLYDNYE